MFRKVKENAGPLLILGMVVMSLILLGMAFVGPLDLWVALGIILLPLIIYGVIILVFILRNR